MVVPILEKVLLKFGRNMLFLAIFYSNDSPNLWEIQGKIRDSIIQKKTILSFIDVESFHPNQESCGEVNFVPFICASSVADKKNVNKIFNCSVNCYYLLFGV